MEASLSLLRMVETGFLEEIIPQKQDPKSIEH